MCILCYRLNVDIPMNGNKYGVITINDRPMGLLEELNADKHVSWRRLRSLKYLQISVPIPLTGLHILKLKTLRIDFDCTLPKIQVENLFISAAVKVHSTTLRNLKKLWIYSEIVPSIDFSNIEEVSIKCETLNEPKFANNNSINLKYSNKIDLDLRTVKNLTVKGKVGQILLGRHEYVNLKINKVVPFIDAKFVTIEHPRQRYLEALNANSVNAKAPLKSFKIQKACTLTINSNIEINQLNVKYLDLTNHKIKNFSTICRSLKIRSNSLEHLKISKTKYLRLDCPELKSINKIPPEIKLRCEKLTTLPAFPRKMKLLFIDCPNLRYIVNVPESSFEMSITVSQRLYFQFYMVACEYYYEFNPYGEEQNRGLLFCHDFLLATRCVPNVELVMSYLLNN